MLELHDNTQNHFYEKKWAHDCLEMLSTKCAFKSYIQYACKLELALNNL